MIKTSIVLVALLVAGCTSLNTDHYCQIPPESRARAIENIDVFIQTISTKTVTYKMSQSLLNEGKLIRGNKSCYAYLMPQSLQSERSILHGDGDVYVNLETLEVGHVFWFKY